jgi:hypothetical protein
MTLSAGGICPYHKKHKINAHLPDLTSFLQNSVHAKSAHPIFFVLQYGVVN